MASRIADLTRIKYEGERFLLDGAFHLYEDGSLLSVVEPSHCRIEISFGKLVFSCRGANWSRSWRVVTCEVAPDQLRFYCLKHMGRVGCSLDLRRGVAPGEMPVSRAEFATRIAALIADQLCGITVERVLASRDDRRHLSGLYARMRLRDGKGVLAGLAINAGESQAAINGVLCAGLIWLDDLRRRRTPVDRLYLLVPAGSAFSLSCRLLFVRRDFVTITLYEVDEALSRLTAVTPFAQADLADGLKHAASRASWRADSPHPPETSACIDQLIGRSPENVEVQTKNGWAYLSVHGLNFARISVKRRRTEFGLELPRQLLTKKNQGEFDDLVAGILTHRRPQGDRKESVYHAQAERWLESVLRRDITVLDGRLDSRCVYSQVPAYRGEQRSYIDLLAVTRGGRLVIIELKVGEDVEFPFQGLDYWIRVDWHRRRGDFTRRGYFRNVPLRDEPPLIYLVAPLFRFHATTRQIAGVIVPQAPVYRVGINEDWRAGVRVLLRERLN